VKACASCGQQNPPDARFCNRCGDLTEGGGSRPEPVVLLWHGVGPDERDVLEPLARATAALGLMVFVPDWQSDAPDGGRATCSAR
jgi:predicted dienelactone hydrolase